MQKKTEGSITKKIAKEVAKNSAGIEVLNGKVEVLNGKVEVLNGKVGALSSNMLKLNNKVDRVEEEMVTKTEFSEFKNETITRLDKIIGTQEKHEQERVFAYEQMRRHGEQINKHTEEIKGIKEVLNIR